MLSFKSFIIESEEKGGHLHAFDIDGTLVHPNAKIKVMHGARHVETLDHHQYNTHKLQPGHHYDYSEFRSSDIFSRSTPIHKMLRKLQAIHGNIKNKPRHRIILNTARSNFDNKHQFLHTLKSHGIDTDNIRVERAGNDSRPIPTGEKKADIISRHINQGKYKKVSLYDDDKENLRHFLQLKKKHPDVTFHAYHVHHDGSTTKIKN